MRTILIISILLTPVVISTVVEDESPNYHKKFHRQELAETFGVSHHAHVPKYRSTKVNGLKHLTDDSEHKLSLSAFGNQFKIKTAKNPNFVAETHTTEFVDHNRDITKYQGVIGFYTFGVLEGDPMSHVALHHTARGVSGSIRTAKDLFLVHPLPHRLKNKKDNHIVFRASDVPGDHILKGPFKLEDFTSNLKHSRKRRAVQKKKTIELMIAADWKMLEFYGDLFLPTYMLAVANIMAGFFRDASLAYPLDLVVVRSTIFKTDILNASDVNHLLSSFAHWGVENNNRDENSAEHFDVALLFTKNGCADGCGIDGLAYVNVPCSTVHAAGVGKDRGFLTAMTLSHELGHILNVGHDATIACPDGLNIMSSGGFKGGPQALRWSTCSSAAMEKTLMSTSTYCYDDVPPTKKTDSAFQLYGTIYDADKQCKYMMGNTYQKCTPYQYECGAMLCNPIGASSCEGLLYPALHGTYCAPHKWCIDGACVPDGTLPPQPIHGGWSAWSDYTACNKPCDIGIQWKERRCNNPEPENGGNWCDLKAVRKVPELAYYRTCNIQKCQGTIKLADNALADRDAQCHAITAGSVHCPSCYGSGTGPCSLVCGGRSSGYAEGNVRSGTYCTPDAKHEGVCVHGQCTEMGCDYQLKSGRNIDRCKLCNGNGSTCLPVAGSHAAPLTPPAFGTEQITTIPVDATEVVIKEDTRTKSFIGLKVGTSSNFAFNFPTRGATAYMEGAVIKYTMTGFPNQDVVYIEGRLEKPVHVYYSNLHFREAMTTVTWTYTIQGITPNGTVAVHWVTDEWSACSRSCAGGTQTRHVICGRKDDSTPATVELCQQLTTTKPPEQSECNTQNCPAVWYISEWTACSQSCATGTRTRTTTCSQLTKAGTYVKVDESLCSQLTKPTDPTSELCNDISCPAEWMALSAYSDCSKTCEGGVAIRTVGCKRMDKNNTLITVNELECIGINKTTKPETSKICNKDVPCPTWKALYGKCSATCGAGIQTPSIVCSQGGTEDKTLPFDECDQSKKPKTSSFALKDCNVGECAGYKWAIKEGVCSTTCGEGVIQDSIYCYDVISLKEVDYFKCPALEKPTLPNPKICNPGICEDVFEWRNDEFGACSKTCGGGVSKSVPYCVQLLSGNKVASLTCDAGTKPALVSQSCNTETCPPYDWSIVYTDCSKTCGKGVRIGSPRCKKIEDGSIVEDSRCNASSKPAATNKDCELSVCPPPASFHWELMNLGCSVTCGSGVILKEVACLRKDAQNKFTKVTPSNCDPNTQPTITNEVCVLDACPPTHQWNRISQVCAIGCGKGYDIIHVNCTEIKTGIADDGASCAKYPLLKSSCQRGCKPLKNMSAVIYPIGCFADNMQNPTVPEAAGDFRAIYKSNKPRPAILKCYDNAMKKNYTFFALKNKGLCRIGDNNTLKTYDKMGATNQCVPGSGLFHKTNYVYHIGSPIAKKTIHVVKIGCLSVGNVTADRKISPYAMAQVISMCGNKALKTNQEHFGGDNTGHCLTNDETKNTMDSPQFFSVCAPDSDAKIQYHIFKIYT